MFFEEDNRQEVIELPLSRSLELKVFLGQQGILREFTQRDLVKALETFPDCLPDHNGLHAKIEHLKMDSVVNFESNVDPHSIVYTYTEKSGTQTAKLPKVINLKVPYYEGSDHTVEIAVDLDIKKPTAEGEVPIFILSDPRHSKTHRDALDEERSIVETGLKDWMFIKGNAH